MATLNLDELIGASIAAVRAKLPPTPRTVDIVHRLGKDHAGDDAVFITVILGDETPEEQLSWQRLGPVARLLSDAAQRTFQFEVQVIPYVRFATESQARDEGLRVS